MCAPTPRGAGGRLRVGALDAPSGDLERQRNPGQVLDGAVVEVPGDPPPLALGRVDSTLEKPDPIPMGAADPLRKRGGERKLNQLEQDQRCQQSREEREPQSATARRDRAVLLIRLEQKWLPARGLDLRIGLEKLHLVALELVLRLVEVTDVGVRCPVSERALLVVAELERLPDQTRLV